MERRLYSEQKREEILNEAVGALNTTKELGDGTEEDMVIENDSPSKKTILIVYGMRTFKDDEEVIGAAFDQDGAFRAFKASGYKTGFDTDEVPLY